MGSTRFFVLGAGGHGKVVADVARCAGYLVEAFADHDGAKVGQSFFGLPVRSWSEMVASQATVGLGVGSQAARARCLVACEAAGLRLPVLIHRDATVAASSRIGVGTVVMARAVVNPDAVLGRAVIVNSGAIVEHDCVIEDSCHVSPGAALGGAVRLGPGTHVGIGAAILPGVSIGAGVRVGAGAVVTRDVADGATVVGVPARPLVRPDGSRLDPG